MASEFVKLRWKSYIFPKKNFLKILNEDKESNPVVEIEKIKRVKNSFVVVGKRKNGKKISQFVGKKKLLFIFFQERKEKAQTVEVLFRKGNVEDIFIVKGKEFYEVNFEGKVPKCTCKDFQIQKEFFGKGACKHIYKLLEEFSIPNLRTYLEKTGSSYTLKKEPKPIAEHIKQSLKNQRS